MTSPTKILDIKLPDRNGLEKAVSAGDMIEIISWEENNENAPSKRKYDNITRWLEGVGPFKIYQVTQWPCGRIMLYLDLSRGRKPGVYSDHFRYVNSTT